MSSLNRQQREKVNHFSSVTGANPKVAQEFLKRHSWSLELSVDTYFHSTRSQQSSVDAKKVEALWLQFSVEAEGTRRIDAEGVQNLCAELGIEPVDPVTLCLAYHCNAQEMGSFTRDEFCRGVVRLECDTLEKLKGKVPEMRQMLKDKTQMKDIYTYTFDLSLESGQRVLPVEYCVELWKILLPDHFVLLPEFLLFVEENCKNSISKDLWAMTFDLATQCQPDLSDYDADGGAWPVFLDEFVENYRETKAKA
jgi:DCN1-like protein 1/2